MIAQPISPITEGFTKVPKAYSIRHYFKKAAPNWPFTPLQCVQYWKQHGEWPMVLMNEAEPVLAVYEIFEWYQKRMRPMLDQFFTPPDVARQLASVADRFSAKPEILTLDMCSGFGMLSYAMNEAGYPAVGFDIDHELVSLSQLLIDENVAPGSAFYCEDFTVIDELAGEYQMIVSNPPFTNMPLFLQKLDLLLNNEGTAVLILPIGFLQKTRPSNLVAALHKFDCIHAEPVKEPFAQTGINTEIVVLRKRF